MNKIKGSYLIFGEKMAAQKGLKTIIGGNSPTGGELKLLDEVFGGEFTKIILSKRSNYKKIMSGLADVAGVPRALLAGGFDLSYGLRQGLYTGYRHPKEWAVAFKGQFKTIFSEEAFQAINAEIRSRPTYGLMRQAKLPLTDLGGQLTQREEVYFSQLAEKLPLAGKFVRAFGRAYTGFANRYRADIFDKLVKTGEQTGAIKDPRYLPSLGEFIGSATGRGNLESLEQVAGPLATAMFSPRWLKSLVDTFNPVFYAKLQPEVRKEAIKTLFNWVVGTITLVALADTIPGVEVGKDPTSADFMKIKIGNTRIDMSAGRGSLIVLFARQLQGKLTSSVTGKTYELGEGYKPLTRAGLLAKFFRYKEAPVVSLIHNALAGETAIGEEFKWSRELTKMNIPIFFQDMKDLYDEGELELIPIAGPFAFFGAGVQTYGGTQKDKASNFIEEMEEKYGPQKEETSDFIKEMEKKYGTP